MTKLKPLSIAMLTIALAACGGGSGGGTGSVGAVGADSPTPEPVTAGAALSASGDASTPGASGSKPVDWVKPINEPAAVVDTSTALTDSQLNPGFNAQNPAIKPEVQSTAPAIGPAQSSTQPANAMSVRGEGIQPGHATEPYKVPEHLKAKTDAKTSSLGKMFQKAAYAAVSVFVGSAHAAAGDPISNGTTLPVAPTPTGVAANANQVGHWSGVYNWPLIPIHLAMMPDGRLMSYGTNEGGRQTGKTVYSMFDPAGGLLNGHTVLNKNTLADIFCSAQLFLPVTNQFLTIGGDNLQADGFTNNTGNNSSTIFTPQTNTMVAGNNMALPRWYATTTTLANGSTYIQGGLGGEAYPEIRNVNGTFKSLTSASTTNLDYWYPRNFLHPSGRIFGWDSYGNYYWITTTGNGAKQVVNQWNIDYFGEAGSTAVFAPGRALNLAAFSNKAAVIDYRTNTPTLTATAPMEQRRQNVSAVTLPNGQVLATGGSAVYNEIGPNAGVYLKATIWNPATGTWSIGAATPSGIARLYHSVAMLQPDGTVLVGGGGAWGPLSNNNMEVYYPPYMFAANGALATKPKVTAAPTEMNLGQTIQITVDDAGAPITKLSIIKQAAVTHSLNMDQAYNDLAFTRTGNVITATLPSEVAWATPGYYMLFAMTASGTPSQARVIRMNVPSSVTAPPSNAAGTAGTTGDVLTWTQSTSTGLKSNIISRAPTAAGPWTDLADVSVRTTYTVPNTANGTVYYAIKAVGASGNPSVNSNVVTVTRGGTTPPVDPGPTTTVPSAPQAVSAVFTSGTGVRVSWANPVASTTMPATTTNTILRATNAAGPFTPLATIAAAATYLDANQTAGTYYYQVIATNSVGAGLASTAAMVTVTAPPAGGTVAVAGTGLSGYTCGAGCWSTDTGVRFAWTPSTTATKTNQVIERAPALAGPWTVVQATTAVNVGTYVDKNVTSGTTYFYRVRADVGATPGAYATLGYGITSNITLGGGGGTPVTPTPPTAVIPAVTATVGTPVTIASTGTTPGTGATSITGYQWTISTAGAGAAIVGAANQSSVSVSTTAAGTFTISLTVTNNLGTTNTATRTVTVSAAPVGGTFSIESQGETRYLVMNWWRGNPALEGDFRDPGGPGACTGPANAGGNCTLGARKTFRPMAFNIATTPATVAGLIMMDVPQYENGVKTYDHYKLPVYMTKTGCSFSVSHVRTVAAGQSGSLEFPLNPPGLEILPHKFNLSTDLCNSYPTGAMTQTWLNSLNTALTTYLGAKPAYNPIAYPYTNPRTGIDPAYAAP